MAKVADPLRERILWLEELGYDEREPMLIQTLEACANQIDEEHQRRMHQCEHEVRRRLCKDVRWAVNQLEKQYARGWIRQQIKIEDIENELD